jgi:hypothetical protein
VQDSGEVGRIFYFQILHTDKSIIVGAGGPVSRNTVRFDGGGWLLRKIQAAN